MRTVLMILLVLIAACGEEVRPGESVTGAPDEASTSEAVEDTEVPSTVTTNEPGNSEYLDDRTVLTATDSGQYTTSFGNRIELQLTDEYSWSLPTIDGPAQLVQINFIVGPGYEAWEVLVEAAGTVTIETIGTCQECEPGTIEFSATIEVKD